MAATGALGFVVAPGVSKPQEREFTVETTKYAYEPAVIRVNKGDTYQGGIQGELQGPPTGIAGVESLLFDAGCPGQRVQLEFTGRDLEASAPAALAKLQAFSAALTAVPRMDFPFSMQIATKTS